MQKFIFNRKYFDKVTKENTLQNIPDYESKRNILKNWIHTLESGVLETTKEVALQGDFLTDIFKAVLGYTGRIGHDNWTLQVEEKTKHDATVSDGALGFFTKDNSDVRVVIELKDAKTSLDTKQKRENNQSPVEQAFSYQYKHKNCKWVIVSNYKELRIYNAQTMLEYEQFYLEELCNDESVFLKFYYLLNSDNLIKENTMSIVDELYIKNEEEDKNITEDFYKEYKLLRRNLYNHIVENNDINELVALEKTQTILDRFIFICFCEDTGLLEQNIFSKVVDTAKATFAVSDTNVWNQLKGLFDSINKGNASRNINRFNGGLFKDDVVMNNLVIKDVIFDLFSKIAGYDFDSELSVDLLGHVFEQSISDLEEFKAEINGEVFDKKKGSRKKHGVFYTPPYITQYMVQTTIDKWLNKHKEELGEEDLPELTDDDFTEYRKKTAIGSRVRKVTSVEKHLDYYTKLQDIVSNIKVLDPACGSGAFLIATFDYLLKIGTEINDKIEYLLGGHTSFFEIDKNILKNNLYGVDLNKESIEITKLSLWLKTANKRDPLTSLDENIQCGNSVVDDYNVDKNAFVWEERFKKVMDAGGFDVIVGNPPYVALARVDKAIYNNLLDKYNLISGMSDLSVVFLEKATNLINSYGYISYISTSHWMKAKYGKDMRNKLIDYGEIDTIIDFGSYNIFKDATIQTAIIIVSKNNNEVKYTNIATDIEFNIHKRNFTVHSYAKLKEMGDWIFEDFNLVSNLKEKNIAYKELNNVSVVTRGWYTNADWALLISDEKKKEFNIEEGILKSYLHTSKIFSEYSDIETTEYVIYPYKRVGDKAVLLNEAELETLYPNTYKYLLTCKEQLIKTKCKGKKDNTGWYRLENYKDYNFLDADKLVIKSVATKLVCTGIESGIPVNGTSSPVIKPDTINKDYLMGLLNSDVLSKYMNSISASRSGGYYAYTLEKLKTAPIVQNSQYEDNIIYIVRSMRDLTSTRERCITKINSKITSLGAKNSRKLSFLTNLTFTELIEELKKQKIKLTLSEQDDWEEYFNKIKTEVLELQQQIDDNNKELNSMINEIYGVTEDMLK